ncbi:MAG TPA: hypothetical protein VFU69_12420, partial [Ktedonobacterales bacterium]|nr:hypothetical protein [Ktedonobacterales bacterium]
MEKAIRNTLRNVVTECRRELETAIGELLQGQFGIHANGTLEPAEKLTHLSQADQDYRAQVVASLEHIKAGGFTPAGAVGQLIREVAFTHLNRFCAYKLLEKRRLIRETVSRGLNSNGFKLYLADHPADEVFWSGGQQDLAYRHFLEWIGANLSEEIGILFSPNDPANRLFPTQRVVERVLSLLNSQELAEVWDQDETIGWIYQYFTPKELRDQARKESQAPRNSYELAFRNQFYTPRYVVEFLTENTLGRLWYEMRQGQMALGERCRYLVRRKHLIWLAPGEAPPEPFPIAEDGQGVGPQWGGDDAMWTRPNPKIETWWAMMMYALTVDGYKYAQQHLTMGEAGRREPFAIVAALAETKQEEYHRTGKWNGTFEELRICLFFAQRAWRHGGEEEPEGEYWAILQALYRAICEAWEREVEVIPYRPKKDPCELRVLDPASGSGHFLLYCFDLLLTIYEEAWDDPDLGPALQREYRGDQVAYRAAVPGLILRHNLHGIDIDLRSTQIAALALWLRAQRAYQDLGLKGDERPRIRRTNMVCAEPMPGEYHLLKDFERTLDPPALIPLVEQVWGQMKLAAEAGSLLTVERALRESIQQAKRDWIRSLGGNVQLPLFEQSKPPQQQVLNYSGVTDKSFFEEEAEPRALEALQRFAETASDRDGYTRRLFAEDATRGFALIEVLGKEYDVVLMNPPFGEASKPSKDYLEKTYPRTKNDIYAMFIERGLSLLYTGGRLGAITSRTGFFLTTFQKWREEILLKEARPAVLADLGYGVLDTAMVET